MFWTPAGIENTIDQDPLQSLAHPAASQTSCVETGTGQQSMVTG
ncbi:MAG: hypothetical protein VX749_11465 [Pseudomonadota bacterium]|nr:hypothetical protein [Pseudomonadota bacterium]